MDGFLTSSQRSEGLEQGRAVSRALHDALTETDAFPRDEGGGEGEERGNSTRHEKYGEEAFAFFVFTHK